MRSTTLYNIIKLIALLGVCSGVMVIVLPTLAMNKVIEGTGLAEPIEIELDFSESDYLLVTASQSHADYSLSLMDRSSGKKLKEVSVDYPAFLNDVLLVDQGSCDACSVIIKAVTKGDRESPYQVSIKPLIKPTRSTISMLTALTASGVLTLEARNAETEDETNLKLEGVVDLLIGFTKNKLPLDGNDFLWRHHGFIFLAHAQKRLEQFEAEQLILSKVVSESNVTPSIYRSNALFALAKSAENVTNKLTTYDHLIKNALTTNDSRFVALGSAGKAVALVREAQFEEAIRLLEYADELFTKQNNARELLIVIHNLSWANQRAGNLPESLRYASDQQLLSEAVLDRENKIWSLYNFAMTYGQMGDAKIADEFLDEALDLLSTKGSDVSFDTDQISAYLMLEKTQRALQFGAFELANDYAVRAKTKFEKIGDQNQAENVKFVQGEISMALGDHTAARNTFLESVRYNKENNRVLLSGLFLLRLAELEILDGNYIEAAPHQAQALSILSKTEDYKGLAKAFSQAVELLYRLGALDDAEALANRVGAFIQVHSLEQEKARFFYRRALLSNALDSQRSALAYLQTTIGIIENTLPKVRRRDLRQSYLGLQKSVFELSIEIALADEVDGVMQSLVLAESFRTRTLKESINSIDVDSGVDAQSVAKRAELLKKIQQKALAWHAGDSQTSVLNNGTARILEDTRALSLALQKLETKIETSRQKQFSSLSKITVDDIPVTQSDELVAYYFIGQRQSWLWVLTAQTQDVYTLPAAKPLQPLVTSFIEQIVTAPSSRSDSSAWSQIDAITQLSDVLLSPIEKHLNQDIRLITVVADGALHAIPFAPLRWSESDSPLIMDYAIVKAPSLIAKDSLRKRAMLRHTSLTPTALVVADPISSQDSNLNLARLHYSTQEAQYVESHLRGGVTALVSEKALKKDFLAQLNKPYSILHFATHGLLNSKEPALSGLVFSESEDGDGLWLAPEISRTDINANLVVLSACESSVGKNVSGEGLFSLGRAFIEAGANQVVGTLWKVQDQATSKLVEKFYSNLLNHNVTVAQSLQQAQKAIYQDKDNDWSDPYYWAAFQLQGGGVNQSYASSY